MSTTVDLVLELATVTDWLAANLLPGTRLPYRPELSAEKRSELAVAARMVQREAVRSGMLVPLGQTPAPANLEILDLLVEILTAAATFSGIPAPRTSLDDPQPHLAAVVRRLRAGRLGDVVALEDVCEDLIERAHRVLGLIMDGQLLTGLCPWCRGRTMRHPLGGARTLRVRLVELPTGDALGLVPAVVCESRFCQPPDADFGMTWHGRPAWPLDTEGKWLADRIERAMLESVGS